MLKKSYLVLSLLAANVSAFSFDFTPFTTLAQAEEYCPSLTGLIFTPCYSLPTSAGMITGTKNSVAFKSTETMMHPKNLNSDNKVEDAQFRFTNNMYGYQSGNGIICFYTYTGFTGATGNLNLKGTAQLHD